MSTEAGRVLRNSLQSVPASSAHAPKAPRQRIQSSSPMHKKCQRGANITVDVRDSGYTERSVDTPVKGVVTFRINSQQHLALCSALTLIAARLNFIPDLSVPWLRAYDLGRFGRPWILDRVGPS